MFYDKPLIKFERILETYVSYAPRGWASFLMAMPLWLKQKLHLPNLIKKSLVTRAKYCFPSITNLTLLAPFPFAV